MGEYLSPGVFIEEIPARLKAIEGVSTSTAGFVGGADRGPMAGFVPFQPVGTATIPAHFKFAPDPTPVLVTSFADYQRVFGAPPADPKRDGYLGHAVQAFFNNGGRRCFVARAVAAAAKPAKVRVNRGVVLRLARAGRVGDPTVFLTSLRGLNLGAGNDLSFKRISDDTTVADLDLNAASGTATSATLAAAAGLTVALDPDQVYAVPAAATAVVADEGPQFIARGPGTWGNNLRVLISNSDRPPVKLAGAVAASDTVQVATTGSFYRGALAELDKGATRERVVVLDVLPANTLKLSGAVTAGATDLLRVLEIDVTLMDLSSGTVETFRGLSWNGKDDPDIRPRHYSTVINARSRLAFVQPPWAGLGGVTEDPPTLDNMPSTRRGATEGPTGAGEAGVDAPPGEADVIGTDAGPGKRTGIQSLQDVDDIRIVAAPGFTTAAVQGELITQCERMRYRFAVLDGQEEPAGGSINAILTHRNSYDSSFAALYVPWVQLTVADNTLVLPPSGHVIGIYARTDNDRGVHKAPANETVRGVTGLSAYVTTGEQDLLNPRGVNAIRRFEGRGIRVWGARTLSSDPEFRYVNVRRFLIFMEASIDRGTQWVVFEPNHPDTWGRVVDSVSAFLHTQWRNGALFGRRPEDAFFVRCDETTMTVDDIQNGRLICQIGVAIVRPAEFVIFRIEQITGMARQP